MIPGARINAADLLAARVLGLQEVAVRSPKVRLIDVAAPSGEIVTASFIADCLKASGAAVNSVETAQRDAGSIGRMLEGRSCDLFVLIGGTGAGRNDPTAEALAARGTLLLHNIAMQPGGTAAVGRLENKPVIALPGAPDQAFAGLLALVQPVVDRLSHRSGRRSMTLPLQRKISSTVGVTELVLMRQEGNAWMPLAVGDFTLDAIRLADGWLAVPGSSEGYAAGTPVAAWLLRECM